MEEALLKINQVLDDFYSGKLKDRNQLIKEWISFLDTLKEACKTADPEQKAHYRQDLSKLANKLAEGMLVLTKDASFAEEDINSMVENPDNFKPDAWSELKDLKAQLDQKMKIILPLLLEEQPAVKGGPQKAPARPPKKKPRSGERRRKRRSGWLSS